MIKQVYLTTCATLLALYAVFAGAPIASAQNEPVLYPWIECAEQQEDGKIRARFGYVNNSLATFELPVLIPETDGTGDWSRDYANYFSGASADLGQPRQFVPGQHYLAFDVVFSPQDLLDDESGDDDDDSYGQYWRLTWHLSNQSVYVDRDAVEGGWMRCGVRPIMNCVTHDDQDLLRAYYGYVNSTAETETIPISGIAPDTYQEGPVNCVTRSGDPEPVCDQKQPTVFEPGQHDGVFSVGSYGTYKEYYYNGYNPWMLQTSWTLDEGSANTVESGSQNHQAVARYDSRPCRVQPLSGCLREGCGIEGEQGDLSASFGYNNLESFSVNIGRWWDYGYNRLYPRHGCYSYSNNYQELPPSCRQPQPTQFAPGRHSDVFSICFNKSDDPGRYSQGSAADAVPQDLDPYWDEDRGYVQWGLRATNYCWWGCSYDWTEVFYYNDGNHTQWCNRAPICEIGGSYTLACEPDSTNVELTGWGSKDPDGDPIKYAWSHDCAGGSLKPVNIVNPILSLTTPAGASAESCSVTLTVTEETSEALSSSCSAAVEVDECPLVDCAGTTNGTAKTDKCGVCNGDGTSCLGCSAIKTNSAGLDNRVELQRQLVERAVRAAKRAGIAVSANVYLAEAQVLADTNLSFLAGLPVEVQTCENKIFCVSVSGGFPPEEFLKNSHQLRQLVRRIARKLRAAGDVLRPVRLTMRAWNLHRENLRDVEGIPLTSSKCY